MAVPQKSDRERLLAYSAGCRNFRILIFWSEQKLLDKYQSQLEYYARALEQITGKKVREKIIYSFTMQKELAWK